MSVQRGLSYPEFVIIMLNLYPGTLSGSFRRINLDEYRATINRNLKYYWENGSWTIKTPNGYRTAPTLEQAILAPYYHHGNEFASTETTTN